MERRLGNNRVIYTCSKCNKEYAVLYKKQIHYTGFSLVEGFQVKMHLELCKQCEKSFVEMVNNWLSEKEEIRELNEEEFKRVLDRVHRSLEFTALVEQNDF